MNNISKLVLTQREYFFTNATLDVAFRLSMLVKLRENIVKHENEIVLALKADLNKSEFESELTEVSLVISEINYFIKNIHKFARRKKCNAGLAQFPSKSYITPVPYGVCLIMSPWNYPFQLCLEPLTGAIAAGNTVILKPSNYSPATSTIIEKIIQKTFDEKYVAVISGGREANTELLKQKFDYIFFTGGTTVGKVVMHYASENLIPMTLELGGKSPCIIDSTADIALAAKRITWGKYLNAGQTCVAPDYFFIDVKIKDAFVKEVIKNIEEFYTKEPLKCDYMPRIINEKHFLRILKLIEGENILYGGHGDLDSLKIEPTILDGINFESPVMQEEIFGPIMPLITFENILQVVDILRPLPHPLSFYLFSNDEATQKLFVDTINFGGGCINDVVLQIATSHMPFGGVGASGMGLYHGKSSFDTFSHHKSVVHKSNFIDLNARYMPPTPKKISFIKRFLRK